MFMVVFSLIGCLLDGFFVLIFCLVFCCVFFICCACFVFACCVGRLGFAGIV